MREFIQANPEFSFVALVLVAFVASPFVQRLIGRTALKAAIRTETVVDDLIVDALRPYRFVYAAPAAVAFIFADWVAPYDYAARLFSGLLLIYLGVETVIKALAALAAVIRQRSGARGVSSTGYIDLLKILTVIVGIAIAASITIDTDVVTLLGGLGAATAVLGFIFKDTLHAIFASMQIASWNLIREGDWVSVPAFSADGTVEHIGLYHIKVRNWDLTTSLVPTHRVLEVANINFASMQSEARARRIQERFLFDVDSIRLCDRALLDRLQEIALISDLVAEKTQALSERDDPGSDPSIAAQVSTNFELFSVYVDRYLRTRKDVHQKRLYILVRALAPTHHGLPLDIWAFARETDLIGFSQIQSSIFNHLVAMIGVFDLRLYQLRLER